MGFVAEFGCRNPPQNRTPLLKLFAPVLANSAAGGLNFVARDFMDADACLDQLPWKGIRMLDITVLISPLNLS